ncbi:serine dehydratase beta chain, partial [Klebsiella pneumoniae]
MISLFDMFKVGIGPSSSHTVGPMKAGKQFVDDLVEKGLLNAVTRVAVDVYGSLSLTGKGHHTDIAIIMGLAGNQPDTVDIDAIPAFIRDVEARGRGGGGAPPPPGGGPAGGGQRFLSAPHPPAPHRLTHDPRGGA